VIFSLGVCNPHATFLVSAQKMHGLARSEEYNDFTAICALVHWRFPLQDVPL
jgi:hypothetical protein